MAENKEKNLNEEEVSEQQSLEEQLKNLPVYSEFEEEEEDKREREGRKKKSSKIRITPVMTAKRSLWMSY